jgi:predicted RNA polymerase sigma factor
MQYALLIYTKPGTYESLSPAEREARLGRGGEARAAYQDALALTATEPERRFLRKRIAEG